MRESIESARTSRHGGHGTPERPRVSVVAPAFNEAEGIAAFVRRTLAACRACAGSFEVVLVDDGSRDDTWARMRRLAAAHPQLVCVKLSRNHGHQLALTAGLTVCRGERILIIDADLQDPPELLAPMLEVMDRGADVVYAQRRRREGESWFKLATANIFYRLIERLSDTAIPRDTGDFRLMSRRALDVLLAMPEQRRFIRGMVSWIGFRQEAFLYDREPRFAGVTKFPVRRMVRFAGDAITSFSTRPLAWSLHAGGALLLIGLLTLLTCVSLWFAAEPAHWAWALLGAGTGLAGLQLLFIGVLGVYIGRMAEQLRGRPLFVIEDVLESSPPMPEIVVRRAQHTLAPAGQAGANSG
jgi:glycosyltransferase involved in cell wall biosynthesis